MLLAQSTLIPILTEKRRWAGIFFSIFNHQRDHRRSW